MPYVTVFDITQKAFEWWWFALGLIFVFVGIVLIKYGLKLGGNKTGKGFGLPFAFDSRLLGWFFVIFASFWTLLSFGSMYCSYREYTAAYRSGQYSVVEGTVEDFHPMPYEGHQEECFRVQEEKFCYSDYDLSKPGFNQSTSHGGPVRAGLPVRIAYRDDRILRLEICVDSFSSEAERVARSEAEKQRWEWWVKDFRWGRSSLYFALAMVFGAAANGCAFFVLHRMKILGRRVGYWRTVSKDIALYKEYWRLAPSKNWSRAPLIVGIISFILAAYFLFHSVSR